jgi:hypothetical protein
MAADCNRKNPLIRSGTPQAERLLSALNPAYISVDERSPADLILFAQRFSSYLKYYTRDNVNVGNADWLPFFSSDVSAVLAGLSRLPAGVFQNFARSLQAYLADDPGRSQPDLANHFKLIFHLPLRLLVQVSGCHDRLATAHPLRRFIQNLLDRDVKEPLASLISYYQGAPALADAPLNDVAIFADTPLVLADYNTTFDETDPRIQLPSLVTTALDQVMTPSTLEVSDTFVQGLGAANWAAFYAAIQPDTSPYVDGLGSFYHQIYDALNYNLLSDALERLFQSLERIALEAATYLEEALTGFERHTPHYGLWLAFLRLFRFNQAQLNTLTERHLNYYYQEILQLCRRRAEPDQVHLLLELNKNREAYLLQAEDTLFKAGKDTAGIERNYRLDYDFVVNRAKVAMLKSLYLKKIAANRRLPFAAPVTNSADGQGEALPKDNPQWKPFGPAVGLPNAHLGFALADRKLFLREGRRIITIQIEFNSAALPPPDLALIFKASLTSADGWLTIASTGANPGLTTRATKGMLHISIELNGDDPPIIPYEAAIHGEGYAVAEPILKVELSFTHHLLWKADLFAAVRDLHFDALKLKTEATGLRNFSLQNEFGVLDITKPFLPFGSMPGVNAPLILGSSEVFSKKLAELKLNLEWEQALDKSSFFRTLDPSKYTTSVQHLKTGTWQQLGTQEKLLFSTGSTSKTISISQQLADLSTSVAQSLENESYSPQSRAGFIKLLLKENFGHKKYLDEKTLALIDLTTSTSWNPNKIDYNYDSSNIPYAPYTPKIINITLDYATTSAGSARFFHLYPFGFKEESSASGRLLPQLPHEGELYLGIQELDPPQRLSLLFQTVDGSANPLKAENTLQWHYLKQNNWLPFEDQFVDDKTFNLTGSGIVSLAVPDEADTEHTLLPSGLHWFRLAVVADADALNNLLSIDAQAVSATFEDQGNDLAFLATPLAAGTIAKLKVSAAAIKKINQPYASFGGKPEETDQHFYIRASERLRHKNRASTMWDYEHLVLEHFPHIYKVKCINHTQLYRDTQNNILADNEVKPGYVLVVPIPYVSGQGVADSLRPYTDKKTIGAIDRLLRARISPFVQLEVQNPKIEEVQVKFKVAFTADIADIAFYKEELQNAIIRFLSPWAFDEGAEISFGGQWHKSTIINFVEEQFYVDYLKDFEMYHKADISQSDKSWLRIDEEVVEATTCRSILVSHRHHLIEEIV